MNNLNDFQIADKILYLSVCYNISPYSLIKQLRIEYPKLTDKECIDLSHTTIFSFDYIRVLFNDKTMDS